MNTTWIVAKTREVAAAFAKQQGWKWSQWNYGNPSTMAGISHCKVVFIDGWKSHPRAQQIEQIVQLAKHVGVKTEMAWL